MGKKYFESEDKFNRIKGKYARIQDKHEGEIPMLQGMAQELQQLIEKEICYVDVNIKPAGLRLLFTIGHVIHQVVS